MIFEIEDFKVEIKAHHMVNKSMKTEEAMKYFINVIAMLASEASKGYKEEGADALSDWARRIANETHNSLRKLGFYD